MEDRKKKIFKELAKIVGEEYVSIDKEDLVPYSRDVVSQALKLYSADYVVAPGNVEEVQQIVKVANKYKVNLYPYAFGTSISAAALPREGGMMMVLRRMNRILKIDVDTRTAIVEPGVTWSKLFFETKKFGLHPWGVGGGPNTGGPVGNFALGGGNTGGLDINEVVSIEIVLPSGELMRTASAAYMGHEEVNPYCRVCWGPNFTGVFRGSLGMYGIVTKLIRRLYPIREIEDLIQVAFNTLQDCCLGMKDLVDLGFIQQAMGIDRPQCAILTADPELTKNPEKYAEFEDSFPAYVVNVKTSCHNGEQANIYRKIIKETAAKYEGTIVEFSGYTKKYLDEWWNGSSTSAIRYLRHLPHIMAAIQLPPKMIPGARELTLNLLDELDYKHTTFSGKEMPPRQLLSPWERNESYWYEQNIEFDPTDPVSVSKFKTFQRKWFDLMFDYGGSTIIPTLIRRAENKLMPSYVHLMRGIKSYLDPNGIFAPGQILRD